MTPIARPIATISISIQKLAGIPDAEAKADRIIALETAIAKVQWTARTEPRRREDLQPDDPRPAARRSRRSSTWDRALAKARASASQPSVVLLQKSAIAGRSEAVRIGAARDLEGLARRSTSSAATRQYPAQGVRRRPVRLLFEDAARRARAARPLEARRRHGQRRRSAKASARSTSQRHYPPESDRQMGELIDNIRAALQEKIETNTLDGCADRRQRAVEKLATLRPAHRPPGQIYRLFDTRR